MKSSILCAICISAMTLKPAVASEKIELYVWRGAQAALEEVIPHFTTFSGIEIEITGLGTPYPENIEQELIYNDEVDAVGLFSPSSVRFSKADWIIDLSDNSAIEAAAQQHYPHLRQALYDDKKLIGLGLASALYALPIIDLESYAELGLSREDFPKDWDALYEQVDELAKIGHRDFFFPAWFDHHYGLAGTFIAEVMNRGGTIVDPNTQRASMPVDSGPAFDVLQDWRRAWLSGAIPKHVLELNYFTNMQGFIKGSYAIGVQSNEVLLHGTVYNSSTNRIRTILPRMEQPWGMATVGLFSHSNSVNIDSEKSKEIQDFLLWISLGTKGEEFYVQEKWLNKFGYLSVYKEYMESDRAKSILEEKLAISEDVPVLLDIYEHAAVPHHISRLHWQDELYFSLAKHLKEHLNNPARSTAETISALVGDIDKSRRDYGF